MEDLNKENILDKDSLRKTSFLYSKRVRISLSLTLTFLAAFLFMQTIKTVKEYRYVGVGITPSNIITVSGEGEAFSVPDTAEFTFSILENAETAGEVQDVATKKANEAIKALVDNGIEEKDIKTVAYNLNPKYEWMVAKKCVRFPCEKNRVQVGFELSQAIKVKVRNLDKAGEMLGIVTNTGVSSVSGLTFTIADEDSIKAEARKQAIDEAKTKAEKLAKDLGVSLVRIVGFSEDGYMPSPVFTRNVSFDKSAMSASSAEISPNIPAGENKLVSNVHITYEIR
jgi:uncharacterized protein YggE